MSQHKFVEPKYNSKGFHCPYCQTFASQRWSDIVAHQQHVSAWVSAICAQCGERTLWISEKLVYPDVGYGDPPNADLPKEVREDYEEAAAILRKSPRGAAALLRLGLQKLCAHLGEPGKNINDDIASLVKKGLPAKVQQALDYVRVVGNHAVHPGTIDLKDDVETATNLFKLLNIVADKMISEPKQLEQLYLNLPQPTRDAISKRDAKKP